MTTLRDEFEALMPEPFGYVPFPGEFYPPDELDDEVKNDPFVTRVYSAAQMRKAISDADQTATERAAKLCDAISDGADFVGDKRGGNAAEGCAAAIRGGRTG